MMTINDVDMILGPKVVLGAKSIGAKAGLGGMGGGLICVSVLK